MKIPIFVLVIALLPAISSAEMVFLGNGESGFGGNLGNGSLSVSADLSAETITFCFDLANSIPGTSDALVLYLDTVGGGFGSTQNFTDNGDDARSAVSGFDGFNRSLVNFDSGFEVDFAITAIGEDQSTALFGLNENSSHSFLGNGTSSGSEYKYTATFSQLGIAENSVVRFGATYLNADNAFRSNEGLLGSLNFGSANAAYSDISLAPLSFTVTGIPEPATLVTFGASLVLLNRRKRNAA